MSAAGVAAAVTEAIASGKYDFILVNFANPDMVGHTGDLPATIKALEAVDAALGQISGALRESKGALIVTSDHGNCEKMKDENGKPFTAHTTNPVPLYYANYAGPELPLRSGGRLCDVAPMMLEILGIP
ncbi:MAG: alkaline phosphatase family protein, partial [Byssovorax sp.]